MKLRFLALAVAAWYCASAVADASEKLWRHAKARTTRPVVVDDFEPFAAVAPRHYARYRLARGRFDDAHALTFHFNLGEDLVYQMYDAREETHEALGEIRMRLANDLDAEMDFVGRQDALDDRFVARIEDAMRRSNVHGVQGPMPRKGLRAVGDFVA